MLQKRLKRTPEGEMMTEEDQIDEWLSVSKWRVYAVLWIGFFVIAFVLFQALLYILAAILDEPITLVEYAFVTLYAVMMASCGVYESSEPPIDE